VSEREPSLSSCPSCGKLNRVRPAAAGAPHCGACGSPLPWLVEADEGSFASLVEESPLPVLVDFWAPWCGPCRMVAPAVERLSRELAGRLKVAKVNTDQAPSLGQRFGVRSIPTLALVDRGRERGRVVGVQDAASLRQWLSAQLETSSRAR
jgi:thioredoxin 2